MSTERTRQLGIEIRVCRKKLGLTQRQLSEASGVSQRYISAVETGKANPSINELSRIADSLGKPLYYFIKF